MKRFTPILVSLLLLVAAAPAARAAKIIDRTVVTVNDDVILESDIDKFVKKGRSKSFQELFGGLDDKTLSDRNKVLQLLIEEKLIDQQVKKLDIQASPAEIDGQIKAICKRNNITQNQLAERLKQLGTSMDDYRQGLRRQLERKNLVEREIKPSLEVSDEQLRHFYQRNAKADSGDMQYKIAHILIENKEKGGMSAAERAKKVYAEVSKDSGNFDKYVKEYSDDTTTSDQGGVLGFFGLSSLAREFRSVVPKTPAGQVTQPIKTKAGYHIVKVLEARSGDFASLSKEQKEALRNQMVGSELEKKMAMWLERRKNEAHIRFASAPTEKAKTAPEK